MNRIVCALLALFFTTAALADGINISGPSYLFGAWTPTLVGSATPGTGQTYAQQVGSYEQLGRQVTIRFSITATSLGTAAGNIKLGNLPVANVAENGMCVISFYTVTGLAALNYVVTGVVDQSASTVSLYQNGSTASINVTIAQAGASAAFIGYCNYRAS